jgi:hypothetical protein
MRVSLLLLRDVAWLAALVIAIVLAIVVLAITRPPGKNVRRDP